MNLVFTLIVALFVFPICFKIYSGRIINFNEKKSDKIHFVGHINIFSYCRITLLDDQLLIDSDTAPNMSIRFSSIIRVKRIKFFPDIVLLSLVLSDGLSRSILLGIDSPNVFVREIGERLRKNPK